MLIFGHFQVDRIRLSHDNTGPNPEWYLEFLKIEIPDRNEKYLFPCNRWLTGDEDRRVEVEVYPGNDKALLYQLLLFILPVFIFEAADQ